MGEIMDDYDAGFEAGFENGHECGTEHGFENGKGYAQEKVLKLMDEVIHEYRTLAKADERFENFAQWTQISRSTALWPLNIL